MKKIFFVIVNSSLLIINCVEVSAQIKWANVDSLYRPLPKSVHIYFTNEPIDTSPFRSYYLIADLKDKKLDFTVDTTLNRRITPTKFYEKDDHPLLVMNCSFFSFETNRNLNVLIRNGKILSYNIHSIAGRGKDTLTYKHPLRSALGISKKRKADVAWLYTDSTLEYPYRQISSSPLIVDSSFKFNLKPFLKKAPTPYFDYFKSPPYFKWKMQTAVGGGPVLLQNGEIKITNEEEMMFAGKAINDKHPRTAMGYTKDGKLIILMIEGRNRNAGGATLTQEAQIFKELGCWEALNLDGGGSSCMLVNGKQTIKPSDITGQRPVPAVFEIFVK